MRAPRFLTSLLVGAGLLLGGCGDNVTPDPQPDPPRDSGVDPDPEAVKPCLDRSTDLPRPSSDGRLPCELIPPSASFAKPGPAR